MIKPLFLTIISALIAALSIAQRATCPSDTLGFVLAKSTTLDTISFQPNFTSGVFQYFECPQEIAVNGTRFHAWKTDTAQGDTMTVVIELRKATNDSVPGQILVSSAEVVMTIPDSMNGPLSAYAIDVTWASVNINFPYTIVVKAKNPTGPNFSLLHTHLNGTSSDGNEEWLAGVRQGVSWVKAYDFITSSQPFDADWIIQPFVKYNINASFVNDPECLFDELGEYVNFYNDGSPITDSRMYNRYAFFNQATRQRWNFGDGTGILEQVNQGHFYPTNGPYVVNLTTRMLNWTFGQCQSTVTQIVKEKPAQDFSYTTKNLEVDFTNKTFGLFSSIRYDFGDGNHSLSEDPIHKYVSPGNYWVCQTMETSCGEIKQCKNVAVATNTALNCGKDSVRYTAARATDIKIKKLKPTNPGRCFGLGQIFDANQSMIVHGFSFYANHEGLFKDAYPVTCKIFRKGGNQLPTGQPLATSTVFINKFIVDTNYSDTTRYTAIFNTPVAIQFDYILTIEYDSTVPIHIGVSDWIAGDGDKDRLAIGKINDTTWVSSSSNAVFNCEGADCDMDVIIEPLIEFNLDANFFYDFECMDMDQQPVVLYDNSSQIIRSKIYNTRAFYTSSVKAFEWDFDDGSPILNLIDPQHSFVGDGPFDVTLTIFMDGWTIACNNSQTLNIPVHPVGKYGYEQLTSQVTFTDSSSNVDEYLWIFSDNTISTLRNPVHYFTEIGRFEVCQYVSNVCGSDTNCDSITVNVVGIPENYAKDFHIYPNPARDYLSVSASFDLMDEFRIDMLDLSGRLVKSLILTGASSNGQLYVGDLARGTYLLKIKADEFEGMKKIILTE